jgi:hypothetical protein
MALDWEPLPKPKPGQEKEFEDLFHKLEGARGQRRERLLEWFANVSDPAFTLIGAPRVGYDEAADEWLVKRVEKQQRMAELEEIQREMRGYCVLALLPPCDGFPVYSNYVGSDSLERYAFNAELVLAEHELIGDELWDRAHTAMLPVTLAEFAEKLHEAAQRFVLERGLPGHVETIREPVFPEGSQERRGHVLFAAAKWATYWSFRGHGMMPV